MEESTITTLATESLKPFSAIVDALLSAKLQRIKIWAEEQENRNRLEHYKTNIILEQYLKRLLRRISEIKTIVFPLQPFPLPSLYEPLSLRGKFDLSEKEIDKEFNAHTLNAGENYLIIDSAGMGKSTFVKHLVLDVVNSTIKIPIFLELRRIEENETLLQRIAKDIDESQTGIDEKLLLMLLDQGNFVVILDGYDELSDKFRKRISQQITELAVRCDQNSLILTARPEVNLPEIPNSKAFTINRLEKKQAEAIALRYDKVTKLDIGKQLIMQFDKVNDSFLQTPLFIALLYKTYSHSQSIATKITSFYDDVFNALYKGHDLTKSGFSREKASKLDAENYRRLLRGFSFLMIAKQKNNLKSKTEGISIITEAIKLTSVIPTSAEDFFDDLLLTVPLLVKDGTDFRFIHKSLGEFFAAEFLAFTSGSQKIIEKIRDGKSNLAFFNSFEYLADINPSLFKKLIVAPLAKEVLKENAYKNPYLRSVFFLHKGDVQISSEINHRSRKGADSSINIGIGLKKERYRLAISLYDTRPRVTFAAWRLITKQSDIQFGQVFIKKENELHKILPLKKWINLKDKKIIGNISHVGIRDIFCTILYFRWFGKEKGYVRVLDNETCKNLLLQIKQEEETHKWVSSLIAD